MCMAWRRLVMASLCCWMEAQSIQPVPLMQQAVLPPKESLPPVAQQSWTTRSFQKLHEALSLQRLDAVPQKSQHCGSSIERHQLATPMGQEAV